MKITKENYQIWKDLFEASIQFRDLKPWEWMANDNLFAVQDPNTGLTGYCCIMGRLGEVLGIAVYIGAEGFEAYDGLMNSMFLNDLEKIELSINQHVIKVEFVNNNEADKVDKAAYKALGLKFRGKNQYVQIREMKPDYFLWYINDEQAQFLTHIMQQAVDVVKRVKLDKRILNVKEDKIFTRIASEVNGDLIWADSIEDEPVAKLPPERTVRPELIKKVKNKLERIRGAICFALFYLPSPVQDGKDRPYFVKMGLWINYSDGSIMAFKIFTPTMTEDEVNEVIIGQLEEFGIIPLQILVNTELAETALKPIADALNIELLFDEDIEAFNAVYNFLQMQF